MRIHRFWLPLVLAGVVTACDDDGVQEPGMALSMDEAEDVAAAIADEAFVDMSAEFSASAFDPAAGPSAAPSDEVTRRFERTRPCPQGGQIVFAGTSVAEIDAATRHVVIDTEATRTHDGCVLPLRRHDRSIELNGAPNVAMSAHFEREMGLPAGTQTVSLEGAVDWQIVDTVRAGTCEIELDVAWQRTLEGGFRNVDGVVCGREIHVETTWTFEGEIET